MFTTFFLYDPRRSLVIILLNTSENLKNNDSKYLYYYRISLFVNQVLPTKIAKNAFLELLCKARLVFIKR